jgi:TetR/AcrR family acrAB operon transcriptional repressor
MKSSSDSLEEDAPVGSDAAVRGRLLVAARRLAQNRALNEITLSQVAREANVTWPTVRRHFGSRESLQAYLLRENPGLAPAIPGPRPSILEAAARVFSRRGYSRATLDEVGAEAGMTKGAVYWHFASKADLFSALVDSKGRELLAGMAESIGSALTMDDPREGLARILALQLSAVRSNPLIPRLFFEFVSESRTDGIRERLAEMYRAAHAATGEMVMGLRKQGRVSEKADPEAFAMLWTALLDGLCLLSLLDPHRVEPERLAPLVVDAIWNGIKRRYGAV